MTLLTGVCKEDFKRWRIAKKDSYLKHCFFEELTPSMQWGVYVDFFESTGIDVDKIMMHHYKLMGGYSLKGNCRESALEKANEIYNAQ